MGNRELIIPARFDSRDMLAGLKAVEESGQAAGDLGQTADAASARFRKAHESVESALREFNLLRRSLQQAPGDEERSAVGDPAASESARWAGTKLPTDEWPGPGEDLRGAAGARLGASGTGRADEKAGGTKDGR